VDVVYDTSSRLPGVKGGGDTGVCGAAVWGKVSLCMAGASCDWLGGNLEKLI